MACNQREVYNVRSNDPYLNRFIQPDTLIPSAANPQSWNRYAYVLNNPINFNDPSGHKACDDEFGCENHPKPVPLPTPDEPGNYIPHNSRGRNSGNNDNNRGGRNSGNIDNNSGEGEDSCHTLKCRAQNGDKWAWLEYNFPSHWGWSIQASGAVGLPEGFGVGGEISANFIYYWRTDQLIFSIDPGVNAGWGAKLQLVDR